MATWINTSKERSLIIKWRLTFFGIGAWSELETCKGEVLGGVREKEGEGASTEVTGEGVLEVRETVQPTGEHVLEIIS